MDNVEDKIKTIFSEIFKLPTHEIGSHTTMDSLANWDSMGHLLLISALQNRTNLTFSLNETLEMISYPAIVSVIRQKLSQG